MTKHKNSVVDFFFRKEVTGNIKRVVTDEIGTTIPNHFAIRANFKWLTQLNASFYDIDHSQYSAQFQIRQPNQLFCQSSEQLDRPAFAKFLQPTACLTFS